MSLRFLRSASCERCVFVTAASWSQRLWRGDATCAVKGPQLLRNLHIQNAAAWLLHCRTNPVKAKLIWGLKPSKNAAWHCSENIRILGSTSENYWAAWRARAVRAAVWMSKICSSKSRSWEVWQKWLVRIMHYIRFIKMATLCNSHVY